MASLGSLPLCRPPLPSPPPEDFKRCMSRIMPAQGGPAPAQHPGPRSSWESRGQNRCWTGARGRATVRWLRSANHSCLATDLRLQARVHWPRTCAQNVCAATLSTAVRGPVDERRGSQQPAPGVAAETTRGPADHKAATWSNQQRPTFCTDLPLGWKSVSAFHEVRNSHEMACNAANLDSWTCRRTERNCELSGLSGGLLAAP